MSRWPLTDDAPEDELMRAWDEDWQAEVERPPMPVWFEWLVELAFYALVFAGGFATAVLVM